MIDETTEIQDEEITEEEVLTMEQVTDMFNDMLDDCYETIEIAGCTFYPSQILKDCDPIAYDMALDEYADYLADDYTIID